MGIAILSYIRCYHLWRRYRAHSFRNLHSGARGKYQFCKNSLGVTDSLYKFVYWYKTLFHAVHFFNGRLKFVKCTSHIVVKADGETPTYYDVTSFGFLTVAPPCITGATIDNRLSNEWCGFLRNCCSCSVPFGAVLEKKLHMTLVPFSPLRMDIFIRLVCHSRWRRR